MDRHKTPEWVSIFHRDVISKITPGSKVISFPSISPDDSSYSCKNNIHVPEDLLARSDYRNVLKVLAFEMVGLVHKKKLKALWWIPRLSLLWVCLLVLAASMGLLSPLVAIILSLGVCWWRYKLTLDQYKAFMYFEEVGYSTVTPESVHRMRLKIVEELSGSETLWCMPFKKKAYKDLKDLDLAHPPRHHKMLILFLNKNGFNR